jgi:hypothetical protein
MTMTTMTTTTPREGINQTGPLLGNDMANVAIGIVCADQVSYMSRLLLGYALAFDCG